MGVAGSGKSTWIQNNISGFEGNTAIISRDIIRFSMIKEGEDYFSKEKEVWKEYVRQARESITGNDNTILDATHLNEASRGKILRALGKDLKDVEINAIVIKTSLEKTLEQNGQRTGLSLVPEDTIRRMYSSFTVPVLNEGFDNIWIYWADKKEKYGITYSLFKKDGDRYGATNLAKFGSSSRS